MELVPFRTLLRHNCLSLLFLRTLFAIFVRIFRGRNASEQRVRHFVVIRPLRGSRFHVLRFVVFRLTTNGNGKDFQRLQAGRRGPSFT